MAPRTPKGCEECLGAGGRWVHLRVCLTCGHVGCSFEPDEDWAYCYVDDLMLEPAPVP